MALNFDTKFEEKLTLAFKNGTTRCSVKALFYLGNKWVAQLATLFTHVLQNRCS